MRLLANENIPLGTVRRLRQADHNVLSITETSPGISDTKVLSIAHAEQRILLTFDRDYGELIYVKRLPCPAGLIYLRFTPASPEDAADRLAPFLAKVHESLYGQFVVLDREGYRQRPLPKAGAEA
jgi:predicted nuclease of predicted toxin-antitoxin system